MPLESGTRLGPYEILAPLGAGGMGEVYRSRDTRLDRVVAIKVLPAHLADRADLRERFEREARAVSSLNHPHICTLHDVGEQDGTYFLVNERWQTASDLTVQLQWIAEAESRPEAPAAVVVETPVRRSRVALSWIVAAVFFVLTVGLTVALLVTSRSASGAGVVRFFVSAPDKAVFENRVQANIGATAGSISPDGAKLTFTARDAAGRVLLWLRPLDALTAQPLLGTEGAGWPFWSPDSRWIAFFAQGKLKKIDMSGGPPQILCDAPNGRGGTWNQDGVIVFAPGVTQPLFRVSSAGGGEAVVLTKLTTEQTNHRLPAFLPDGKHFIYWVAGIAPENSGVFVGTLDSTESHLLLRSDSAALYSPPGYLLFIRQGTLLAQRFDAGKLQLSGDPVRVAEQVAFDGDSRGFDVSENGLLVYRSFPNASISNVVLAWYDRAGKLIETLGMPGGYRGVELSPDGKRLAIHRHDGAGGDIWLMESAQGPMSRLTFDAAQDNSRPVWSPDGKRIAFGSLRNRKWGLYVKLADGTGNEELLVESDLPKMPASWSPDGKFLVYWVVDPKTGQDAWVLPLTGERKPFPVLQTAATEFPAQISPDGKWIAYNSNETGSSQIHIRPFQSGIGNWQISTNGGSYPRWRGDSKELFYMGAGSGGKVIATEIRVAGASIERGAPRELFDSGYFNLGHPTNYQAWVVSHDGQRFLIPRPETNFAGEATAAPLTVVLNWTTMLPRK